MIVERRLKSPHPCGNASVTNVVLPRNNHMDCLARRLGGLAQKERVLFRREGQNKKAKVKLLSLFVIYLFLTFHCHLLLNQDVLYLDQLLIREQGLL